MATYLESLQTGLHDAFARDPRVMLLGEDVIDPYGGAFKVTKGLSTAFPDRVLATPISEGAITGVAAGLALRGLRPTVEIMFGDFLTLAADQIVNHVAKFPGLYGEKARAPVVIRTPMGGGRGYGATHSQSLEKMFLGVPELRVVAPSHAHAPGTILGHALTDGTDPVLFVEHKLLYPMALFAGDDDVSVEAVDEIPNYPTAILRNHDGAADATVIAYGGLSRLVVPMLASLRAEEIAVTAVLPSSLKPLPVETLVELAGETGRIVIAEEGTEGFNWGAEVAALLYERLLGRIEVPIRRLASRPGAIPCAEAGEREALVQADDIERAILELV
jgi:acetoin:2,6-dichlorophenolindophenol oxidoreductase subunit beta